MNKKQSISILALGDSYTIGEGVKREHSFPFQLKDALEQKGYKAEEPEVIAKTGWTTGELLQAIDNDNIGSSYDLVSLLIGVNNQYRGYSPEEYRKEFRSLLLLALKFAGNNKKRIMVLSIPDWGKTPYAEGKDLDKIAREIDLFNEISRQEAEREGVEYVYITDITRNKPELLAEDRLHPSSAMYTLWVERIMQKVPGMLE